jgi:peptidoglycan hydrolase-like protein with peptidoglycan-binding domain
MKKIIKLTESQLKDIVSKVIKEQGVPMFDPNKIPGATFKDPSPNAMNPKGDPTQFTSQKKLNIGCVGLKSPETNKRIKGFNGETFKFFNNGRFVDVNGNKGNYECGNQANIINLMFDSDPKAIKYFNMSPQPIANPNINCAPQLVDASKGKILKFGCKTQGVKELQNLLDVTPITGYFGNKTLAAVKALQTSKNIKVDGIVGIETYPYVLANGQTNTPIPGSDTQGTNVPSPTQNIDEDDDIAMLDNLFKKD